MAARFREFTAVQVRASIDRIEPQVWRRIIVPSSFNLRDLHLVLQAAFGWMNAHLHEFEIGGLRFGHADIANAENGPEDARAFDETGVKLRDFTREPGTIFRYVYDMGASWQYRSIHNLISERSAGEAARPGLVNGSL